MIYEEAIKYIGKTVYQPDYENIKVIKHKVLKIKDTSTHGSQYWDFVTDITSQELETIETYGLQDTYEEAAKCIVEHYERVYKNSGLDLEKALKL